MFVTRCHMKKELIINAKLHLIFLDRKAQCSAGALFLLRREQTGYTYPGSNAKPQKTGVLNPFKSKYDIAAQTCSDRNALA